MSKIDINKYLGKWYEIARIPTVFQRDMTKVTAEYVLNEDKTINVINSGYVNGELIKVTATALTTDKDDLLKITFSPYIYSDYKILAVDENYQNALVGGESTNKLWILARTPRIDKHTYTKFISIANKNGYNTQNLKITD